MPEIYVHAVEGRTLDQKRALVRDITAAVVKNFNVPADSVMVEIVEFGEAKQGERRRFVQRAVKDFRANRKHAVHASVSWPSPGGRARERGLTQGSAPSASG